MSKLRLLALVTFLSMLSSLALATSASRQTTVAPAISDTIYVWYDGDQPRRAWLDPDWLASFDVLEPEAEQAMRSIAPPAAAPARDYMGMQLWPVANQSANTIRSLQALEPGVRLSPVLRDGPSANAPLRALPGGVILHLDPELSAEQAQQWLQDQELEVVEKLSFGRNVFLIASAAGLETLQLANRLRTRHGVVAASPDWWQELAPR